MGVELLENAIDQVMGSAGRNSRALKDWRGEERLVIRTKVKVKD